MDKAEIEQKVREIIQKYSSMGRVTDVRLNPEVMNTLDPRPPLERINAVLENNPFKIDEVWVSAYSELEEDEFYVAFISTFESALDSVKQKRVENDSA